MNAANDPDNELIQVAIAVGLDPAATEAEVLAEIEQLKQRAELPHGYARKCDFIAALWRVADAEWALMEGARWLH